MKTYAVTIEIDREECDTYFIDAENLEDLKTKFEAGVGQAPDSNEDNDGPRTMDWDYDVTVVYEFLTVVPHPKEIELNQ
jgi:hypothetical protein